MLRANLRDLRTEAGEHYADILLSLYQRQLKELHEEQEADRAVAGALVGSAAANAPASRVDQGSGSPDRPKVVQPVNGAASSNGQHHATAAGPIDKSTLPISTPRRIRDKEHLRFVASQPCIVCGRSPGHAHHLRFAQPRALGRKVSDEWTVPLCAAHHRALHTVGDEKNWWKERQVNPITHATQLWREKRDASFHPPSRARELICP
jgi:hypothetical protein